MDMNPLEIIEKYYGDQPELKEILLLHSRAVARKARQVIDIHPELGADPQFVEEASLLHDIGIFLTDAPSICCHGKLPYICHGVEGRRLLDLEGYPAHALICERHTGSGLTAEDIRQQHLPLPLRDMLPLSTEEKIVCYADKFFSKSGDLEREKPLEKVRAQLAAHGEDALLRFEDLHALLG